MALMPKRVKFRKAQRGRLRGLASRGNTVVFGQYGFQALEKGWVSAQQLEAGRVAAAHFLGTEGKLWMRVFPDKPVTATPAETRMGKGKGEVEYWAAVVRPGNVIYEVAGVSEDLARQALNRTAHKMPLRVRFLHRRHAI
jgi:large subunit ribosomal protein L16